MDLNQDFWRGRRVLVTGHTGFKGSWCTVWLHRLGAQVLGYALKPATQPSLYELAAVDGACESILGDIRDRVQLKGLVVRFQPEVILHFAAQSLVRASYLEPFETYETNVLGTASVLEAVRATRGVRAVLVVTSDKCYENHEGSRGYRETDPLGGRDPYSSSKACAELLTSAYRASFFGQAGFGQAGIGIATARAGNVIGGGDWAADRLIPDLIRAFIDGRSALIRNPASTRPWQHVLDPLNGYLSLAERLAQDASLGQAWNFGPALETVATVGAVADEACRLWGGGARWQHDSAEQPHEAGQLTLDATKARTELGWKPRLGHREALEWTVEWYKAQARGADPRVLTERQLDRFQELSRVKCRFCQAELTTTFVDLGMQPLSNAYVEAARAEEPETFYPLHARVCGRCFLVQVSAFATPERIFGEYAYLSSVSESWLAHCRRYATAAVERFGLGASSLVLEIASNDGYLLKFFRERRIPTLGIEPAANVAAIAEKAGVQTLARFFSAALARELVVGGRRPDLIVANNVLAHVPDLNDFVEGLAILLKPEGVATIEVPHLLRLIEQVQFDTIYHEHFSYFSLSTVLRVFEAHGLETFDVEELPTHGGSLRLFVRHRSATGQSRPDSIERVLQAERLAGLGHIETYQAFTERVNGIKRGLLRFLIEQREAGNRVVGYGAPAKGNTLLNSCGIRSDLLEYTVDRNSLKQGKLLPGSHIPVVDPERLRETRPAVVLILPWNLREELAEQLAFVHDWGGKLMVPLPALAEVA